MLAFAIHFRLRAAKCDEAPWNSDSFHRENKIPFLKWHIVNTSQKTHPKTGGTSTDLNFFKN